MKITVISHWYNEELLADLFLDHYSFADEINIMVDDSTNDRTSLIMTYYPKAIKEEVHCPNGFDDQEMINNYNRAISEVKEGWIILAPADEFVFPEFFENPRTFLARQTADVVMTHYWHVYKHHTERAIDLNNKAIPQRTHGFQLRRGYAGFCIRGNVFRASAGVQFRPGAHELESCRPVSEERFIGSHWKMASLEIALRRIRNRDRFSKANRKRGYGNHDFNMTEERIKAQLEKFSNEPLIPELLARKG